MSDPFKPTPGGDKPEGDSRIDAAKESTLASIKPDFKATESDLGAGHKDSAQTSSSQGLTRLELEIPYRSRTSYTFPLGQQQPFFLKKSEFLKPDEERTMHSLRPLISNFLNDTAPTDEHKLSVAELKELYRNREQLSRAQSLQEAVNSAFQITRFFEHLKYIEEAKKARDLLLGLAPHHEMPHQLFKEIERMHPPDIAVTSAGAPPARTLSKRTLRRCISRLSGGRVIVLGDLLIDELLEGKPERISREAPVLILEHVKTELILGGAANTAANLAALGGACHAIGVCGRDEYAHKLSRLFEKSGISFGLVEDPSRPTTVKTRILSSAHALRQQLLRMDRISHEPICASIAVALVEKLKAVNGQYKAVILSDYRGGVITDEVVNECMVAARESGLSVIVDAQGDFSRFKGATVITPNQPDAEAACGFKITSENIEHAGRKMLELSGARSVLITRGADGMALFEEGKPMFELPAFNRSEVFDVTGAGDTVVAALALAFVTGSSLEEAVAIGNLAAGIVVKKPGTDVTNQAELLEALESLKMDE